MQVIIAQNCPFPVKISQKIDSIKTLKCLFLIQARFVRYRQRLDSNFTPMDSKNVGFWNSSLFWTVHFMPFWTVHSYPGPSTFGPSTFTQLDRPLSPRPNLVESPKFKNFRMHWNKVWIQLMLTDLVRFKIFFSRSVNTRVPILTFVLRKYFFR